MRWLGWLGGTFLLISSIGGDGLAPAMAANAAGVEPVGERIIRIRVMTLNIHHGEGLDGRVDLARLAQLIRHWQPDLVGLQEVDRNWGARSNFQDQAAWLAGEVGMQYAFAPALRRPSLLGSEAGFGNALLSRYPLLESRVVTLPRQGTREDRSLLIAQVKLPGQVIQVGVTHLGLSREERIGHVRIILDELKRANLPTVLMGDWNDRPDAPEVVAVTFHLQDVVAAIGQSEAREQATFRYDSPDGRPNVRIDYIFVSGDFQVEAVQTVETGVSDHLPVVADLIWPRKRR